MRAAIFVNYVWKDRISSCRRNHGVALRRFAVSCMSWKTGASPAQRFLEKGNGQLALRLQRRLIETLQQVEQRAHAALAAGENETTHFVAHLQPPTRGAQLQGAQLVLVGQLVQLENQSQGQPRLQVGQLNRQFA